MITTELGLSYISLGKITNTKKNERRESMLWTIIGLLLIFWVLGFVFHIAGGIIHLLLIGAAVMFIVKLVSGRSRNKA